MEDEDFDPYGELQADLDDAVMQFFMSPLYTVPVLPGTIWHYTTADGLLGILRSKEFWATDLRYVNDPTEVQHGERVVAEELDRAASDRPASAESAAIYDGLIQQMKSGVPHSILSRAFSTSFCTSEDLLHQWMSYGDRGRGFAIGFAFKKLYDQAHEVPFLGLQRVLYDDKEQRSLIRNAIDWSVFTYSEVRNRHKELWDDHCEHLWAKLLKTITFVFPFTFKGQHFEIEKEWRLIFTQGTIKGFNPPEGPAKDVQFRTVRGRIVPYLELDLCGPRSPQWKSLPIVSIVYGSALGSQIHETVIDMLDTFGYGMSIEVRRSDVPLV